MSGFLERLWYYPISDLSDEPSAEFVELTKKRNHYYDLLPKKYSPQTLTSPFQFCTFATEKHINYLRTSINFFGK